MKSKSDRAEELVAQLIDLVRQAAENPATLPDLDQAARTLGDRLVELLQESDDQADGTR